MMVQLPKVTRQGTRVDTAIQATDIKGIEPKVFTYNGSMFNGAKVYGPAGSFYVAATPLLIMQAQCIAISSGEFQIIEAPKMQYVGGGIKSAGMIGQPKQKMFAK